MTVLGDVKAKLDALQYSGLRADQVTVLQRIVLRQGDADRIRNELFGQATVSPTNALGLDSPQYTAALGQGGDQSVLDDAGTVEVVEHAVNVAGNLLEEHLVGEIKHGKANGLLEDIIVAGVGTAIPADYGTAPYDQLETRNDTVRDLFAAANGQQQLSNGVIQHAKAKYVEVQLAQQAQQAATVATMDAMKLLATLNPQNTSAIKGLPLDQRTLLANMINKPGVIDAASLQTMADIDIAAVCAQAKTTLQQQYTTALAELSNQTVADFLDPAAGAARQKALLALASGDDIAGKDADIIDGLATLTGDLGAVPEAVYKGIDAATLQELDSTQITTPRAGAQEKLRLVVVEKIKAVDLSTGNKAEKMKALVALAGIAHDADIDPGTIPNGTLTELGISDEEYAALNATTKSDDFVKEAATVLVKQVTDELDAIAPEDINSDEKLEALHYLTQTLDNDKLEELTNQAGLAHLKALLGDDHPFVSLNDNGTEALVNADDFAGLAQDIKAHAVSTVLKVMEAEVKALPAGDLSQDQYEGLVAVLTATKAGELSIKAGDPATKIGGVFDNTKLTAANGVFHGMDTAGATEFTALQAAANTVLEQTLVKGIERIDTATLAGDEDKLKLLADIVAQKAVGSNSLSEIVNPLFKDADVQAKVKAADFPLADLAKIAEKRLTQALELKIEALGTTDQQDLQTLVALSNATPGNLDSNGATKAKLGEHLITAINTAGTHLNAHSQAAKKTLHDAVLTQIKDATVASSPARKKALQALMKATTAGDIRPADLQAIGVQPDLAQAYLDSNPDFPSSVKVLQDESAEKYGLNPVSRAVKRMEDSRSGQEVMYLAKHVCNPSPAYDVARKEAMTELNKAFKGVPGAGLDTISLPGSVAGPDFSTNDYVLAASLADYCGLPEYAEDFAIIYKEHRSDFDKYRADITDPNKSPAEIRVSIEELSRLVTRTPHVDFANDEATRLDDLAAQVEKQNLAIKLYGDSKYAHQLDTADPAKITQVRDLLTHINQATAADLEALATSPQYQAVFGNPPTVAATPFHVDGEQPSVLANLKLGRALNLVHGDQGEKRWDINPARIGLGDHHKDRIGDAALKRLWDGQGLLGAVSDQHFKTKTFYEPLNHLGRVKREMAEYRQLMYSTTASQWDATLKALPREKALESLNFCKKLITANSYALKDLSGRREKLQAMKRHFMAYKKEHPADSRAVIDSRLKKIDTELQRIDSYRNEIIELQADARELYSGYRAIENVSADQQFSFVSEDAQFSETYDAQGLHARLEELVKGDTGVGTLATKVDTVGGTTIAKDDGKFVQGGSQGTKAIVQAPKGKVDYIERHMSVGHEFGGGDQNVAVVPFSLRNGGECVTVHTDCAMLAKHEGAELNSFVTAKGKPVLNTIQMEAACDAAQMWIQKNGLPGPDNKMVIYGKDIKQASAMYLALESISKTKGSKFDMSKSVRCVGFSPNHAGMKDYRKDFQKHKDAYLDARKGSIAQRVKADKDPLGAKSKTAVRDVKVKSSPGKIKDRFQGADDVQDDQLPSAPKPGGPGR